jgi:hypothetical protein
MVLRRLQEFVNTALVQSENKHIYRSADDSDAGTPRSFEQIDSGSDLFVSKLRCYNVLDVLDTIPDCISFCANAKTCKLTVKLTSSRAIRVNIGV